MAENFEGAEKTLELEFRVPENDALGLRAWSRSVWDDLLAEAQCTIMSHLSTERLDAYILSESSLFVYRHLVIVKTCGKTALLRLVPLCIERGRQAGWEAMFLLYRRKNLLWPELQTWPHGNPSHEQDFLSSVFPSGEGYVLGPTKGDHWYLYLADNAPLSVSKPERTFEIMMHDCHVDVLRNFWNTDKSRTAQDVTRETHIATLIPDSKIQDQLYQPCGYSMNGVTNDGKYWTIHVTPEDHCSYISFETNVVMTDYSDLVNRVIALFKPRLAIVALIADQEGKAHTVDPVLPTVVEGYKIRNKIHTEFEGDYHCWMYRFVENRYDATPTSVGSSTSDVATHPGSPISAQSKHPCHFGI